MNNTLKILTGVLLRVEHCGVLITGQPGSGKSTLALHLLERGHTLIADDAPIFQTKAQALYGHCDPVLHNFLCVPPLGVINIKQIFGDQAVATETKLDYVVSLDPNAHTITTNTLAPRVSSQIYMGVKLPTLLLHPSHPSSWPLLIETAIKNFKLKQTGYDSYQAFVAGHQTAIENTTQTNYHAKDS